MQLITNEQAREKFCPFRVAGDMVKEESGGDVRCDGDRCMMWRVGHINKKYNPMTKQENETPMGYCGLAGFPPIALGYELAKDPPKEGEPQLK